MLQNYFVILNASFIITSLRCFFTMIKKTALRNYNDNEIFVKSYRIDLLESLKPLTFYPFNYYDTFKNKTNNRYYKTVA